MSNPVIECLLNHRSVRRFKPTAIDEETVRTLILAGTRAATAGNLQMYTFLVLDDPERIALFEKRLAPVVAPPLIIIALLDLYRIKRWLTVADANPPVLNRPAYFMLGLWDALIALQNVVVAAESLGLGTCYFGSILEFDVHEHFGVPEHVFPAGMVCIGHPDGGPPPLRERLPLEAVLHRNAYQRFDDETIRRIYRQRDALWDSVSTERKEKLAEEGIHSIPQAIAVQRFSDEATRARSQGILANLRRAGFTFED